MTFIVDGTLGGTFPSWTTATRPSSPASGQMGYNSTLSVIEYYNGSIWQQITISGGTSAYTVQYLLVAGGGGGGGRVGGGGGGGGVLNGYVSVSSGTAYTLTLGAGGAGGASGVTGAVGSNTTGFSLTVIGGGNGMGLGGAALTTGGSGGGSAYTSAAYGAGTAGQGFSGNTAYAIAASYGGGGGGGAGQPGFAGQN